MQCFETLACDVGINLGRGNVSVTQQQLNYPQVCTVVQQMGREGVAEDMRREWRSDACQQRVFFDDQPK